MKSVTLSSILLKYQGRRQTNLKFEMVKLQISLLLNRAGIYYASDGIMTSLVTRSISLS